ncbi:group II intron maturase-specific domain-containing protein [Roseateles sp.]|uniref:group II intron maturase-specific domain-containing protein n=1 Tax=Roseateles sp. TaxID=1971397 RepID=UPI002AA1CEE5|nr:hypothetical protein [Roseateles sp.]
MVRHEAKATRNPQGRNEAAACCACPTGESAVPVSVGAPGSRHQDVRSVIAELNPVLRGWGGCLQTGDAAKHFLDVDAYVVRRLRGLRVKRAGRNLSADRAQQWGRDCFERLGLHRLRGTIRHSGKAPVNGSSA